MSSEHFERKRFGQDAVPAQNDERETSGAVQTVVEPFAEFGRRIDAQLLELEACHVLAGTPPRQTTGAALRGRLFR